MAHPADDFPDLEGAALMEAQRASRALQAALELKEARERWDKRHPATRGPCPDPDFQTPWEQLGQPERGDGIRGRAERPDSVDPDPVPRKRSEPETGVTVIYTNDPQKRARLPAMSPIPKCILV